MKRKYSFYKPWQSLLRIQVIRALGVLIAVLLSLQLLVACNTQSVTLSFVIPQTGDEPRFWEPLIAQFEAKYPNIKIELANLEASPIKPVNSDQTKEQYVNDFKGDKSFDLIYMDIIWVPEFASHSDWLMDLTQAFPPKDLENEFLKSEVANGIFNGKLYRVPFRTDAGVLYYRKDLLNDYREELIDRAGISPETLRNLEKSSITFEELEKISTYIQRRFQEQGEEIWGYLWQGWQSEALVAVFTEVLHGFGGFWIQNGQVGLDSDEAIQAVEFLRGTIATSGISPGSITELTEEETRQLFREGKAIFMRNWPYAWTEANSSESEVSGKVGVMPMAYAKDQTSGSCKGGWGFGIAKSTPHRDAAIKAVQFFTSAAVQRQFTLSYGSIPSRRRLFFDPQIVAQYSHYPQLLSLMDSQAPEYWVARPRIAEYDQASCILQKHLSEVLRTGKDPREAMTTAAAETGQLLQTGTSSCRVSNSG